eukprot:14173410-Heterocapsa_arctica.AAC.1
MARSFPCSAERGRALEGVWGAGQGQDARALRDRVPGRLQLRSVTLAWALTGESSRSSTTTMHATGSTNRSGQLRASPW